MKDKASGGLDPETLWCWFYYVEKSATMEVLVTQDSPERLNKALTKLAKQLAIALAIQLAEFVANHLNDTVL